MKIGEESIFVEQDGTPRRRLVAMAPQCRGANLRTEKGLRANHMRCNACVKVTENLMRNKALTPVLR